MRTEIPSKFEENSKWRNNDNVKIFLIFDEGFIKKYVTS